MKLFARVAAIVLISAVSKAWAGVTVALTAPANGATVNVPVTLSATASATNGYNVSKVEFFDGSTLIGTATTSPYGISWNNAPAGSHTLTAKATATKSGNPNQTATSSPISVTVNASPVVTMTSPADGATFTSPANVTVSATATDSDGTITRVEFAWFGAMGEAFFRTITVPPYSFVLQLSTGMNGYEYQISATAWDDRGAFAGSNIVNVTLLVQPKLYFLHTDHLNTPRAVYDDQQQLKWKWEQQEPFGVNVPDENPSGLGEFEFPLRFPGQYFDKETNLAYNHYRDYDAGIGRYVQPDPVGLRAGFNLYGYGDANPLSMSDSTGLATDQQCCQQSLGLFTANDLGIIVCCEGRKVGCANPTLVKESSSHSGARGIIEKCVVEHETEHQTHIACNSCSAAPTRPPFRAGVSPEGGECLAYARERRCLLSELNRCGKNVTCRNDVHSRIDFVDSQIRARCGAAMM